MTRVRTSFDTTSVKEKSWADQIKKTAQEQSKVALEKSKTLAKDAVNAASEKTKQFGEYIHSFSHHETKNSDMAALATSMFAFTGFVSYCAGEYWSLAASIGGGLTTGYLGLQQAGYGLDQLYSKTLNLFPAVPPAQVPEVKVESNVTLSPSMKKKH